MGYAGGSDGPVQNPDQNAGYLDERHKDYQEQARKAHLADQAHPTWWQRLIRGLKRETPTSED
jgi:hypothetical protein